MSNWSPNHIIPTFVQYWLNFRPSSHHCVFFCFYVCFFLTNSLQIGWKHLKKHNIYNITLHNVSSYVKIALHNVSVLVWAIRALKTDKLMNNLVFRPWQLNIHVFFCIWKYTFWWRFWKQKRLKHPVPL